MRFLTALLLAGCASASSEAERSGVDAQRADASERDAASPTDGHVAVDAAPLADAAITVDANPCAYTGALATWNLSAEAGSQTMTAGSTTVTGVVAGALTRASGLTATSGAGSINSSGWATSAARDTTKYYAFSITPPSGCAVDLTSLAIDTKSSGSGPASVSLATSADNFAASTAVTANMATTVTVTATSTTALEIRVYGYAATAASGTMRIQNTLTATGTLH